MLLSAHAALRFIRRAAPRRRRFPEPQNGRKTRQQDQIRGRHDGEAGSLDTPWLSGAQRWGRCRACLVCHSGGNRFNLLKEERSSAQLKAIPGFHSSGLRGALLAAVAVFLAFGKEIKGEEIMEVLFQGTAWRNPSACLHSCRSCALYSVSVRGTQRRSLPSRNEHKPSLWDAGWININVLAFKGQLGTLIDY